MTTEWITDRRPSEEDAHWDGYVRMCLSPGSEEWRLIHWSYVGAGVPWRHPANWEPKPALSPLEEVVKQLKELRDRIQPILDLLPPN